MVRRPAIAVVLLGVMTCQVMGAQTPRGGSLDQRVTSVTYQENNVVEVHATYGISTMIIFDEEEEFTTLARRHRAVGRAGREREHPFRQANCQGRQDQHESSRRDASTIWSFAISRRKPEGRFSAFASTIRKRA